MRQNKINIMKNLNQLNRNLYTSFISEAIDKLKDLQSSSIYGCDLHNEMFNTDYYIIGYYQAEQWLINTFGVFNAIGIVSEYEKDNFGEVNTDLSSSEKVANMLAYILGEELLSESTTLRDNWDNHLSEENFEDIINELSELIK